jgi:hypothetical protein
LALPRIDAAADSASRWWCAKSLGVFAPLAVLAVLVGGPILLTPLTIVTALGGPQWPPAALLVVAPVIARRQRASDDQIPSMEHAAI